MKHFISLGAGVQSSTMAIMAAHGEITPMPDGAIFADTQAEPASVYTWLDWLEKQLPFPVYRVSKGSLTEDSLKVRTSKADAHYVKHTIPAYMTDGVHTGMLMRQCTLDYKVQVIQRQIRKLAGKDLVVQWIGISFDELDRMKPSRFPFTENRWPLVDRGIRRNDCLTWLEEHGYPRAPRSACVFCPYHTDREWQRLKTEEPQEFQKAVAYEKRLQTTADKVRAFHGRPFLHETLIPLDQVTFVDTRQLNLFRNECEGMCGV